MGQELAGRKPGTLSRQPEPSWTAVAGTTVRLWLERHHVVGARPLARRRRLVVVMSALVAMAFGAGVTLVFTANNQPGGFATAKPSDAAHGITALEVAQANRQAAAAWVASQVSHNVIVSCDPEMCSQAQASGFPAGQLKVLPSSAPDPLGSELVIATPAIQSQWGPRLASVYAPLVLASFGSGPEQVEIRYLPPGGAAAFNAQLAKDLAHRIAAGQQLLANKNVRASSTARHALVAGRVDPRLLVTLSALAHLMPLHLVAFDNLSPGASSAVPLRGAEIGAATSAGLPAMLAFLKQQTIYAPARAAIVRNKSEVIVRFDAPGPLDIGGS